jgi:class 3 adenylate cyclase
MFADISGFTNLTETLSKIGAEGAEKIAFAINRYMELLIKNIGKCGGDIFKFAGGKIYHYHPRCHDCCMATTLARSKNTI